MKSTFEKSGKGGTFKKNWRKRRRGVRGNLRFPLPFIC
jgi:hypothetical protein